MEDVHIDAPGTIASVAASQGVEHLVHVSSLNAKGNSQSKVYQLKAQGERVLTDVFPQATIIRPSECYGHEDDYFNRYACMCVNSCHILVFLECFIFSSYKLCTLFLAYYNEPLDHVIYGL